MKKNSKIFIAGSNNLVSFALLNRLKEKGFNKLLFRSTSQLNFTNQRAVNNFFKKEKPEYCFLTPIREGGILANIDYPAELFYENLTFEANIIHSACEVKVKKLIFFASSCVYPKNSPQPMKEEYLLRGPLESTSEPYAIAKIAGIKMCEAYNKQYGTDFISVIPATVFGPNDNFDLKTSHVIPSLIRKFHEAKINGKPEVIIWGTGKQKREFIYVDDLVLASLFIMDNTTPSIINVGTGKDLSIHELAQMLKKIIGFKGAIKFDRLKPDGVAQKLLNISLLTSLGWKPKVKIDLGLERTYRWYQAAF